MQGQISYRVADPAKVAANFNYTLAPSGKTYASDDPSKLPVRIVNICQVLARPELQKLSLKEALMSSQPIMNAVVQALKSNAAIQELGVEVFAARCVWLCMAIPSVLTWAPGRPTVSWLVA